MEKPRAFLTSLFDAAVDAARPEKRILDFLPDPPKGKTIVVGAGKASAQMAQAFEKAWLEKTGKAPVGVVVTRYGYEAPCDHIDIISAAHPVPDRNGQIAANRLLQTVSNLSEDDLVVALISGGGSALLPAPPEGLTLEDEIDLNQILLASGAPISAMNTVRKQVSLIKGGRLAQAAAPARVVSLLVSDIPGDNPAFVASGPTIADDESIEAARKVVQQYQMDLPKNVAAHLNRDDWRCPSPDDACFSGNEVHVISSAGVSLKAASELSLKANIPAAILSDTMEGESREVARVHGAIAREILNSGQPFAKPVVLLSGGETTVTLNGHGRGGPNSEFLLSLALEIDGMTNIYAMAGDTDGIDGSEDNSGAFCDGTSIQRMRAAGIDPLGCLVNNDAWSAFNAVNDLYVPGPTGTNVNDFRAILVL